jgi:hypothetical protein
MKLQRKRIIHNTNTKFIMALEMNDLMALKSLENGMSPYEQFKVGHIQQKSHTSGIGVTGLVLGTVGTALAIGAWIFPTMYGSGKAAQAREAALAAKEQANLLSAGTQRQLDQLTNLFAAERQERISGDFTLNQTITDTVSGSQQGQLTAQQQAELAASQVATQQVMTGLMTGEYSRNPQRVALYRDATPCPCPAGGCGCGCNG